MYDATLAASSTSVPALMHPTIAVVGSGPSGCYVGRFLAKRWPAAEITVFESLPVPYGLIRYGVAADHQGAKGVARQFDRMFTKGGVRFAGNVAVGRDISFSQLAAAFDIVVLATGLPTDRSLGIPQESRTRIIGAGALLRALNGYPSPDLPRDGTGEHMSLGTRLAVVGMGNVAVDVVRLLAKDADGFIGSDVDDAILRQVRPKAPATIDVISRSPASAAKCDTAMLREVVSLSNVDVDVTGIGEHDTGPVAELLRPFDSAAPRAQAHSGRTRLRLHFGVVPELIEHSGDDTLLRGRRRRGDRTAVQFAVDSVITAVGFTGGLPDDQCCPSESWSGAHIYRVGWLSRGATGTIPENRKDAQRVVEGIAADVERGRIPLGRSGYRSVEPFLGDRVVDFAGWQRIEAYEREAARPGRCRRKVVDIDKMIEIATAPVTKSIAPLGQEQRSRKVYSWTR